MDVDGDGTGDGGGDFTTLASWTEAAELDEPGIAQPLMLPNDDTAMILSPTDDSTRPPVGNARRAPSNRRLNPSDPRAGAPGAQEPRTNGDDTRKLTWVEKAEAALRVPEPLAALQALVAAEEGSAHSELRARLAGMVQAAEAFTKTAQVCAAAGAPGSVSVYLGEADW